MEQDASAAAESRVHLERIAQEADDHLGCKAPQVEVASFALAIITQAKGRGGGSGAAQTGKKGCLCQVPA